MSLNDITEYKDISSGVSAGRILKLVLRIELTAQRRKVNS